MAKEKIEKIDINLFPEDLKGKYEKARAGYIARYIRNEPGQGFFGMSTTVNDPILGEARWNELYPGGYEDWANKQWKLSSHGQQLVINKINEIVEELNKRKK